MKSFEHGTNKQDELYTKLRYLICFDIYLMNRISVLTEDHNSCIQALEKFINDKLKLLERIFIKVLLVSYTFNCFMRFEIII